MLTIVPQSVRPKVGFALSGSGSRLMFYVGFLEELQNLKVPIDYIASMSGSSIVSAAFACGTLSEMKEFLMTINREKVMSMLSKGKGGLYSLDKIEEYGREHLTKGKRFEEVRPHMGFVASDIETGEQVVMSMGDIARAGRISCTLPFFFEAVKWGSRTLIDGGLLNIVPVDVAKDAGMDIVVGVNVRGTPHLFTGAQLALKRTYNFFKKAFLIEYLESVWDSFGNGDKDYYEFDEQPPLFSVLGKSMDLAIQVNKKTKQSMDCDLMITPETKNFRLKNAEENRFQLYKMGKASARENAPKIFELISKFEKKVEPATP